MVKDKKRIQVFEKPVDAEFFSLKESIAIVIDVLRATSTIINALNNGCKGVVPVADIEQALSLRNQQQDQLPLLCGERYSKRIEGFDLGNSPEEYQSKVVKDKTLIMTTTNGTRVLLAAQDAKAVYVLSLLNLNATVNELTFFNEDLSIICAGTNGQTSLEDNVCAGLLILELVGKSDNFLPENNCFTVITQAMEYKDKLLTMLKMSEHGKYLEKIGYGRDLEFCSRLNSINTCSVYENGIIKKII